MSGKIPRIALTPGEPAGIGPDLSLLLSQQAQTSELVTICDPELLQQRATQLGLPFRFRLFDPDRAAQPAAAVSAQNDRAAG